MTSHSLIGLLNNAALLLALGLLYDTMFSKSPEKDFGRRQIFSGLLIGMIGIAIMLTPWEFMPGVFFDSRSVLLCITGYFFGPVPTVLAILVTGAFRWHLGGVGAWGGILWIIFSGSAGLLWRHFRKKAFQRVSLAEFYVMGFFTHLVLLLCMLTLPWPLAKNAWMKTALPIMIIFPIGTALLGQLMANRLHRRKTEQELVQIKNFTQNALNAQNDTFLVFDPENGKAIWWNHAFSEASGYSDAEIAKLKTPDAFYNDADLKTAARGIHEMKKHGRARVEISLIPKTGPPIPTDYSISQVIRSEGSRPYAIAIGRDMSERKKAEAALTESEARLRSITATAVDAIFCKDDARRYTFANPAMAMILGRPVADLIGKTPEDLFDAESAAIIKEVDDRTFRGGHVNEIRSLNIRGRDFVLNTIQVPMETVDGKVVSISGIVRNITEIMRAQTEKLKLETQLRQSQKLEAIGILSGGIAHDFNNLLYVITGNTELLLSTARPADTEMLRHILGAAQRGADLVKQLLAFSRKSEANLRTVYLNDEVRRIYKMLERVIPKMIEIRLELAEDLYSVDADPGQMEQVLMNLCLNARDAIRDTGTIIIRTENGYYKDQRGVILTVSDTGHGIEAKDLDKIFDPFFTTKEIGKGSGLGLSVIYGIIKAHNGEIFCDSRPGAGTTFTIRLPAAEAIEAYQSKAKGTALLEKGRETILVVDDDENVSTLTQTILVRLGYKTLSAPDGESALEIYAAKKDVIDLVLLDLGMPGMGGAKCLELLIRMDPMVKVVIASGYTEDGLVKDRLHQGARASILKPYSIETMSTVIRKVLDGLPV